MIAQAACNDAHEHRCWKQVVHCMGDAFDHQGLAKSLRENGNPSNPDDDAIFDGKAAAGFFRTICVGTYQDCIARRCDGGCSDPDDDDKR